jgi:NADH:ubiquinone oxidoreductase subunit 6 (subunit J)
MTPYLLLFYLFAAVAVAAAVEAVLRQEPVTRSSS